ncbi:MAG TPA: response regulator transcription factor [Casimicrobiaceae bacterium]|nr:response regulator transcription factor [Casimicrobiaceae bacterium]
MIRVVIADDHTIVREGLRELLSNAGDIEVVGEAVDGHQVLERVRGVPFDVLVLDMSMPGKSGMELIRQVKSEAPKLRIVVLTMHQEHQYAVRAIRAGASGYITKDAASDQLVNAIRKVGRGGAFISAEVAEALARQAQGGSEAAPHESLTDREFQVLKLLVSGAPLTGIGEELHLSVKTISAHKARILQKLGLSNQAELIRYAIAHNLAEPLDRA